MPIAFELIDVLNENGEPSGVIRSRRAVHRDGDLHRTVHVWIMNRQNQVLLQKRAATKKTHPGLWDLSCAGHISHGETSLEAARKEIGEELGIDVLPAEIVYLFSHRSCDAHDQGRMTDNEIHDIYLIEKDIPLSSFTIQEEEVEDLMYVPLCDFHDRVQAKDPLLVPHFTEFERILAILASRGRH